MPVIARRGEAVTDEPGTACLVARNPGLLLVRGLQDFLDQRIVFRPFGAPPRDAAAVIGWGLKGVALRAKAAADAIRVALSRARRRLPAIDRAGRRGRSAFAVRRRSRHLLRRACALAARGGDRDGARHAEQSDAPTRWPRPGATARVSKYNHARESAAADRRPVHARRRSDLRRRVDRLRHGERRRALRACSKRRSTSTRACRCC